MYELAISVIQDYIDECLFEPTAKWPENEFLTRSYERWAGNEILERVVRESMVFPDYSVVSPSKAICRIIEDFAKDMDYQAHLADNKKHHLIFSTARDTAMEIGLLFV